MSCHVGCALPFVEDDHVLGAGPEAGVSAASAAAKRLREGIVVGAGGCLLIAATGHVTGRAPDGRRPSSAPSERPARPRPWGAATAARTRTRTSFKNPQHSLPSSLCFISRLRESIVEDREERKLLLDPSSPPTKALNGAEPNYHSLPSARTDEQALLSSILAKTASNIIDVSAADSQGMEQHEYMDRARQYSTRLAVLSSSLTHWKKLPPLPSLTSQPHQVLASEPIPFSDLQQVSRIAAYAYSALSQIRVDAKEELVVQFGIP